MRENVNAALVQFSPWPVEEMENNLEFIQDKIIELSKLGNELIVFPEMSLTNFFEDRPNGKLYYWHHGALTLEHPFILQVIGTVKQQKCLVVIGFAERSHDIGKIYNSALLIGPEGIIGVTRKVHFPGIEKLYFTRGTEIPVFNTPIGRIGVSICYDSMFAEYLRILAIKGAEIIVMASSIWKGGGKGGIGLQTSKKTFWDYLPVVAAVEHQTFIVACNGGGNHQISRKIGKWERLGLSKMVDPSGEIIAMTDGNEEVILSATLRRSQLEEARLSYNFLNDREPDMYQELVK